MIENDHYIAAVDVVSHGVLRLSFDDGLVGTVPVLDRMWGPVFERARTEAGFREAYVDAGTVAWPGGADLAPDTLYDRVVSGRWWDEAEQPAEPAPAA